MWIVSPFIKETRVIQSQYTLAGCMVDILHVVLHISSSDAMLCDKQPSKVECGMFAKCNFADRCVENRLLVNFKQHHDSIQMCIITTEPKAPLRGTG